MDNLISVAAMKRPQIMKYAFIARRADYKSRFDYNDICIIIISWVAENISGYDPKRWCMRFDGRSVRVYFRNEEDAAAFKLRWV